MGEIECFHLPDNNIVTHACWDNLDMIERTTSGSGTTRTSHRIIGKQASNYTSNTTLDSHPFVQGRGIAPSPVDRRNFSYA